MLPVYVAIFGQTLVLLGGMAGFFRWMGSLTQKVEDIREDVKDMKSELRETSNKTIALETSANMKKVGK